MLRDTFRARYESVPMTVFIQRDRRYADTMPHHHMEFEMTLLTDGAARVYINDRVIEASAGDLILINPLEIHRFEVEEGRSCSLVCCCLDCDMILKERISEELKNEKLHITNLIRAGEEGAGEIRELFQHLMEAYQTDGPYVDMEAVAYVSLLFSALLTNGFAEEPERETKNNLFCKEAVQFVACNYREQVTSADAAAYFAYDQSYFCRIFKKNFGMSFSDYLNRYRVIASREYLEEGQKSITEIAGSCGFRTPAHYAECFRRYLGVLPSRYQKVKMIKQ